MNSSLKERFARLGPVRDMDRVPCGSPAAFSLHVPSDGLAAIRTIDAMHVLARRGLSMLKAKREIEALTAKGILLVELPTVESVDAVLADLTKAGIDARPVELTRTTDVRRLRDRLKLTREQFALRYGFEVEAIKNWETGKRTPDTAARSYLRVICNDPDHAEQAYARTPSF